MNLMNSFLARCRQVTYRRQVSSSSASHGIKRTKEVGDYWLLKTIGRGSSGRVKLGIHKHTGEKVAIKMISRRHLTSSPIITRSVERELAVLQLLHHPHLIYLRQVLQDSTHVYFVMEYIEGGELYQVLSDRGRLPESEARVLFAQMVNALAWCHAHHICHRDLKPENILVDRCRNQIKIADFGMATLQCHNQLLRTSCGSPHYASPEIVKGKPYYGPATDVWSCGVILYALLTGQLPFDDENIARLLARIKTGRYRRFPDDLSHEAKDLLRRMLSVHPAKRPTMEDILLHPWLTGMQSETLPAVPRYYPYADDGPLISGPCDMDGRIWETLKVLWRDQSHEKILTALTSQGRNIPKITFHLLQQRLDGLAPDPTTSLYDSGIAIQSASDAPPTPLLLSDDDECFSNSTTVLSSAGSELPHTPKSGHVLDLFTPSHAPDFYRPLLAKQPPPHHRMQSTRYDCMRRNNDIVHRPQWTLKRNVIVLGKTRPSTYVQPLHPVSSIIQTSSMQFEINMASTDNLQHFFSKLCLWLLRRYSSKKKKEYFAIEANEPQDDPNNQLQQIFQDAKDKYLSHTIYLRAFR